MIHHSKELRLAKARRAACAVAMRCGAVLLRRWFKTAEELRGAVVGGAAPQMSRDDDAVGRRRAANMI